ncbi:Dual specificity phosphatase, catalytic domain [Symmachiella dynata]|uniref:dual specificity protein phosphatase family protein n=1 Tax=Symmachiella dynata TaxID=2527995 RepID=UPI0011889616|nr:dual specificity protein phosphatase [Symmachiella dynata]QDT46016.1 Dual specificity phosphatase, catalytic domain [Symmachiella dynata]
MWKITDRLFLGTFEDGKSLQTLDSAGITHIVNCAVELPCEFPDRFNYLHLALHDPDQGLGDRIAESMSFIDQGRMLGNVLVYCHGAVSRSPAVILAYLYHSGNSFDDSVKMMNNTIQTRPNHIFVRQISEHFHLNLTHDEIEVAVGNLGRPECQ